jgi:lipoprotein-anchoring transpeptidase ErfK/SrfK
MAKVLMLFWAICLSFTAPFCAFAEDDGDSLYNFDEPLYIEVLIKSCKMIIYKDLGDELEVVTELPVATVKKGLKTYPKGLGKIRAVQLNPIWAPTPTTVDYMNKKSRAAGKGNILKKHEIIKPGDKRNAMGTFKMILSHVEPGKGNIYRIHGNNSPSSIGKRASGGCIRMNNDQGLELAKNIKERLANNETVEVDMIEL